MQTAPPFSTRLALGLSAALLAVAAHAQEGSSIVIQGKDNWLFPGWGSLTQVDTRGIDASTQLVRETRDALAAKGIQLEVWCCRTRRCSIKTSCPTANHSAPT